MKNKAQISLNKYENIATQDIYYGYPFDKAMKKEIDGVIYMEVTNSVSRPKQFYIKLDNLKKVGEVTFNKP